MFFGFFENQKQTYSGYNSIADAKKIGMKYRKHLIHLQKDLIKLSPDGNLAGAPEVFSYIRYGLYVRERTHKRFKKNLTLTTSFRFNLAQQEEKGFYEKAILGIPGLRNLCSKKVAYQFSNAIGVETPCVYQHGVPLNALMPRTRMVIKPTLGQGSVGVRGLVKNNDHYDDIFRNNGGAWCQVIENLEQVMLRHNIKDKWMSEELIVDHSDLTAPSDDYKFYMFYGRLGCILHIRRWPKPIHKWYNADWEEIDTGKYPGKKTVRLSLPMERESLKDAAHKLSCCIPQPFCRIDLLSDGRRVVLNELTPAPGGYNQFSDIFDAELGKSWLDAEIRLKNDLLSEKEFPEYVKAVSK